MLTRDLQQTLVFILAGGQGDRLQPLTKPRAKPAVPFGGCYRIIDFTLSNCIHSGLRRIYVLTQYQARSLEEHLRFGWNFLPRRLEQFITARPPHYHPTQRWYKGTADAIFQNLEEIEVARPENVLILSGDHIYKMNYGHMILEHLMNDAAITIGAVPVPVEESRRFGILECDERGRVRSFAEKPAAGKELPDRAGWCLGSMGIYVFKTDELVRRLREDAELGDSSSHDFGKDIITKMIGETHVQAHRFVDTEGDETPYWRDVGTIDAYYDANMGLCSEAPEINLHDRKWPIYTLWHNDPPAKVASGRAGGAVEVVDSLLCPGTVVTGAKLRRSLLSNIAQVGEGSELEESILFRGARVGRNCKLKRTIVDKWTVVPDGTVLGHDLEADRQRFTVTDSGIVVVPRAYDFAAGR
ncbi:MAG: glucose-1-phosphate adenylyltransferase [Planctomycetota bacterium]